MKSQLTKRKDLKNMYLTILAYTPFCNQARRIVPIDLGYDTQDECLYHPRRGDISAPEHLQKPLMQVIELPARTVDESRVIAVDVTYVDNQANVLWTGTFDWGRKAWSSWEYFHWSQYQSRYSKPVSTMWKREIGNNIKARINSKGYGASLFPRSDAFVLCYDGLDIPDDLPEDPYRLAVDAPVKSLMAQLADPYKPTYGSRILEAMGCDCPYLVKNGVSTGKYAPLAERCMWNNWHNDVSRRMTLTPAGFVYQSDLSTDPELSQEAWERARLVAVARVVAQWELPRYAPSHPVRVGSDSEPVHNSPMREAFYLENENYGEYGKHAGKYPTTEASLLSACEELARLTGRSRQANPALVNAVRWQVIERVHHVLRWQVDSLAAQFASSPDVQEALGHFNTGGE